MSDLLPQEYDYNKPRFGNWPEHTGHHNVKLSRWSLSHLPGANNGRAFRNAVTGDITLKAVPTDFPDFIVVDMLNRRELPEDFDELVQDIYLFKAVPMACRTWFFHSVKETAGQGSGVDHSIIQKALGISAIDGTVADGRFSPSCIYAQLIMTTCLTSNMFLVWLSVALFVLLTSVANILNKPELYRLLRPATVCFRLAYLGLYVAWFPSSDILAMVGSVISLLYILVDFYLGDWKALLTLRYVCSYEIVKALNSRVYACLRHGADRLDEITGVRPCVNQDITGFRMTRMHTLIADIKGLVMELVPMTEEDWSMCLQTSLELSGDIPFVGLDTGLKPKRKVNGWIPGGDVGSEPSKPAGFDPMNSTQLPLSIVDI